MTFRSLLAFLCGISLTALSGLSAEGNAAPANAPRIAVIDFDYLDTSGEPTDQAAEHAARLRAFRSTLETQLGSGDAFAMVRLACAEAGCSAGTSAPEMLIAQAEDAGADLLLFGAVHKVSTLIQNLQFTVFAVGEQRVVLERTISFRGDSDQAFERAARFIAGTISSELEY